VEQAPEPSLIQWENLQYRTADRTRRKITTTLLAASLIIISILIAFVTKYYQQQNQVTDSGCPTTTATWQGWNVAYREYMVRQDGSYLGCCNTYTVIQQAQDPVCKVSQSAQYH